MEKKREYYPINKAVEIYGYEIDDLLHFAEVGKLRLSVMVDLTPFECGGWLTTVIDAEGLCQWDRIIAFNPQGLFDIDPLGIGPFMPRFFKVGEKSSIFYICPTEYSSWMRIEKALDEKVWINQRDCRGEISISVPLTGEKNPPHDPDQETLIHIAPDEIFIRTKEIESFIQGELKRDAEAKERPTLFKKAEETEESPLVVCLEEPQKPEQEPISEAEALEVAKEIIKEGRGSGLADIDIVEIIDSKYWDPFKNKPALYASTLGGLLYSYNDSQFETQRKRAQRLRDNLRKRKANI